MDAEHTGVSAGLSTKEVDNPAVIPISFLERLLLQLALISVSAASFALAIEYAREGFSQSLIGLAVAGGVYCAAAAAIWATKP